MAELVYIGMDGGGTSCRLMVADPAMREILRVEGGSSNPYSVGQDRALENVMELLRSAREIAGEKLGGEVRIGGICLGGAGMNGTARELFSHRLKEYVGDGVPVVVETDVRALLEGALPPGTAGICLVCGTGSIASARLDDGRIIRRGGFGWRLGDEGSAWWIVSQAVSRTLKSMEGRDIPTALGAALSAHFGCTVMEEFISLFNGTIAKDEVAAAAPLVTQAARRGDALARDILGNAGRELAALAGSLAGHDAALAGGPMAYAGGVLRNDELVRGSMEENLGRAYPRMQIVPASGTALEGAVRLAHAAGQGP